jgi:hypothetical protein
VACREKDGHDNLIRIAMHPNTRQAIIDYKGRLPGRGAWVHPSLACVQRITAKPAILAQTFRRPVVIEGLMEQLHAAVMRAVVHHIGVYAAQGTIIGGHERLVESLKQRSIRVVVFSSDASIRTVEKLRRLFTPEVLEFELPLSTEEMGHVVGKGTRSALGFPRGPMTMHFVKQLQRLHAIG